MQLPIAIDSIKGFLAPEEGDALYQHALKAATTGPCLEIGSYCGKSTVYLGTACKKQQVTLYSVDHHRGSEEHQLGEEYHDAELYDTGTGLMDSFREFRCTIRQAELEDTVVPLVASSELASRHWSTPLAMVFIDGGHSEAAAQTDYRSWAGHIKRGGILAIHDLYPNPEEGGQAPYTLWKQAKASGLSDEPTLAHPLGRSRRG